MFSTRSPIIPLSGGVTLETHITGSFQLPPETPLVGVFQLPFDTPLIDAFQFPFETPLIDAIQFPDLTTTIGIPVIGILPTGKTGIPPTPSSSGVTPNSSNAALSTSNAAPTTTNATLSAIVALLKVFYFILVWFTYDDVGKPAFYFHQLPKDKLFVVCYVLSL